MLSLSLRLTHSSHPQQQPLKKIMIFFKCKPAVPHKTLSRHDPAALGPSQILYKAAATHSGNSQPHDKISAKYTGRRRGLGTSSRLSFPALHPAQQPLSAITTGILEEDLDESSASEAPIPSHPIPQTPRGCAQLEEPPQLSTKTHWQPARNKSHLLTNEEASTSECF